MRTLAEEFEDFFNQTYQGKETTTKQKEDVKVVFFSGAKIMQVAQFEDGGIWRGRSPRDVYSYG